MRDFRTLVICLILLCPSYALALVNINTASLDELDTLPGVGPTTAEKIVAARPFSATTDIQNVQGIGGPGSKTYEDIIGLITVSGSTAVTLEDDEDEADQESSDSTNTSTNKEKEIQEPVSGLVLNVPTVVYAGQTAEFDVDPIGGTDSRLVRYFWNFGDGFTSNEKNPRHQYLHPGAYVIVVESYFQKQTSMERVEITVVPLSLEVTSVPGGGIKILNSGKHEVDLGGLTIAGLGEFVFPKHTILLAGKSLVVGGVSGSVTHLKDVAGKTLAYNHTVAPVVTEKSRKGGAIATQAKTDVVPVVFATSTEISNEVQEIVGPMMENAAAVSAAEVPSNTWPYLGLLGVMAFGFMALFGVGKV